MRNNLRPHILFIQISMFLQFKYFTKTFSSDLSVCRTHKALKKIGPKVPAHDKIRQTQITDATAGPWLSGLVSIDRAGKEVSGCREPLPVPPRVTDRATRDPGLVHYRNSFRQKQRIGWS